MAALLLVTIACTAAPDDGDPTPSPDATTTASAGATDVPETTPAPSILPDVSWRRIGVDDPQLRNRRDDEPIALLAAEDRLVVTGRRRGQAAAWVSEDGGASWSAAEGVGDDARIGSADIGTILQDGTILLAGAEVEGDSIAASWRSTDGRRFQPVPFGGPVPAGYPFGIVETAAGPVLLDNSIYVFRLDSGGSWLPQEGLGGGPLQIAPLHLPTPPIVRDDGTLLSLALRETGTLLESADDGVTWSEQPVTGDALAGARLRRLVELEDGTLLAGGFVVVDEESVEEALIVRSGDGGATWEAGRFDDDAAAAGPGRQVISSIVAMGSTVVAVGTASADGERWPGAWASADAGRTWAAIHPPFVLAPPGRGDFGRGESFIDAQAGLAGLIVTGVSQRKKDRDITIWELVVAP